MIDYMIYLDELFVVYVLQLQYRYVRYEKIIRWALGFEERVFLQYSYTWLVASIVSLVHFFFFTIKPSAISNSDTIELASEVTRLQKNSKLN